MQFFAECLIIVAGAVWSRDLLPSDMYDSLCRAIVYKLTYISSRLWICIFCLRYELSITHLD